MIAVIVKAVEVVARNMVEEKGINIREKSTIVAVKVVKVTTKVVKVIAKIAARTSTRKNINTREKITVVAVKVMKVIVKTEKRIDMRKNIKMNTTKKVPKRKNSLMDPDQVITNTIELIFLYFLKEKGRKLKYHL